MTPDLRIVDMNTTRIISLVTTKAGSAPTSYRQHELEEFTSCFGNADIRDYFTYCLPVEGYRASNVSVHNLDRIRGEIRKGAGPGGFIFPHGYIVIASSVGGNAICFHSPSGRVVWADHTSFSTDTISFENQATGDWCYLPFTPENIHKAVVSLNGSIESFLGDLLHDKLTEQLDKLD
jgi:hypothetical protein